MHPKQLIWVKCFLTAQHNFCNKTIVGIKVNISSVFCPLKHIAQPKLKVYFWKNALENINEKVKRGNFNQAHKSFMIFSKIY